VVYPGAYSIVALIWCLNNQRLRSINAFWLIILFGGIIFSLGDLVPGLSHIINLLPFINLLRVPSRLMFITGFAFSIITASVTNQLLSKTSSDLLPKRSNWRRA
jgi:hypothetical protein